MRDAVEAYGWIGASRARKSLAVGAVAALDGSRVDVAERGAQVVLWSWAVDGWCRRCPRLLGRLETGFMNLRSGDNDANRLGYCDLYQQQAMSWRYRDRVTA